MVFSFKINAQSIVVDQQIVNDDRTNQIRAFAILREQGVL